MAFIRTEPMVFGLLVSISACSGSGDDSSGEGSESHDTEESGDSQGGEEDDADEGSDGDTDLDEQACHDALLRGSIELGEPCAANSDCASLVCPTFATFNAPGAGTCEPTPSRCRTRVLGSVLDVTTGQAVAEASVSVIEAASATTGALTAPAIVSATSGSDGTFDVTTDEAVTSFLAILGLTQAPGYTPTLTGLASPIDSEGNYEPCLRVREWWVAKEDDVSRWNATLETDLEVQPYLPLDGPHDVMGIVRSAQPASAPLAGVHVEALDETSSIIVRYLNEDGTFGTEATSSLGLFFLFGSRPGERFTVTAEGMVPYYEEATRAGAFPDALYIAAPWMEPGP